MKINIITNTYLNNGLMKEAEIIIKLLQRTFKSRVQTAIIPHFKYNAPFADINIFLETLNNALIPYARFNILIPNQHLFYKTWLSYLSNIDLILTKTAYATTIFKQCLINTPSNTKTKIQYLGMTSIDKYHADTDKDFNKWLHLAGSSTFKNTQTIIDVWDSTYPNLTIVYNPKKLTDLQIRTDITNITYISEILKDNELKILMNECGVHICCSSIEGYGHYINEARSTGAAVIITDGEPMRHFVEHDETGFLVSPKNRKPTKECLGSYYTLDIEDFKETIERVIEMKHKLKQIGSAARNKYQNEKIKFKEHCAITFQTIFNEYTKMYPLDLDEYLNQQEAQRQLLISQELPTVSIITLTKNRRGFIPLAIRNWEDTIYPSKKLEWIIVDDGIDKIKDTLASLIEDDERIKYIQLTSNNTSYSIAEKRNIGVSHSQNEVIVFMDDDDYYPSNSVKLRVLALIQSNKNNAIQCVGSTAIGCFHIRKNISIINQPPLCLSFEERISEATLCFTKSFWNTRMFNSKDIGEEGRSFLKDRFNEFREISWEGVIVSLLHENNTSHRAIPEIISDEPNGNHFGWSDELYLFITSLNKKDDD